MRAVPRQLFVGCHQRKPLKLGLRNKQPVKRVTMKQRQSCHPNDVAICDSQLKKAKFKKTFAELTRMDREVRPAQAELD